MRRFIVLLIIAFFTVAYIGCGGPGKPVTKKRPPSWNSDGNTSNQDSPPKDQDDEKNKSRSEGDKDEKDDDDKDEDTDVKDDKDEKEADSKRVAKTGKRPTIAIGGGNTSKKEDSAKRSNPRNPSIGAGGGNTAQVADTDDEVEVRRYTYFERANQAFATGNETEAFQYLYAHAIVEDDALNDHPLGWYTGISEPRMGLRWGVAVDYRARKFEGDPPKFGDEVDDSDNRSGGSTGSTSPGGGQGLSAPGAGGGNRGGGSSGRTSGPGTDDPVETFEYYTGEFGNKFLHRVDMRRSHPDSFWGKALNEIDATKVFEVSSSPSNRTTNRDRDRSNQTEGGAPEEGGGVAGMRGGGNNRPSNNNNKSQPKTPQNDKPVDPGFVAEFEADPDSLTPGVIMLGVGKQAAMLEKAKAHGVDLLAVFDVSITVSSRDVPKNSTLLSIINVKTGEKVALTRRLNHLAYTKALDDGRDDQIELELDKLFQEKADGEFKASDLPEINGEVAAKRVDFLLKQESENPLPALAEIKYYLEADLISEEDFVTAAESLVGPSNARKLVSDDIEKREQAIADWMPGQYEVDEGDVTQFR